MRRTIVWLMTLLVVMMARAGEVTSQQALQQAQRFMQERVTAGRRAQGAPVQMTMKQVSGLYVFNIAGDGGFVIVSNDDRTVPILGFSDRGHVDTDQMPPNMRAWLQGYADQIAWAKKQGGSATKTAGTSKSADRPTLAAQLRRSHSTTAVAPLVTAHWNQDTPFSDLLHTYNGTDKCVTGCVATAMAQVMYYHKWPQGATASIPGYTSGSTILSSLPATTFAWDDMIDDYPFHYVSVGMQYVKVSDCTEAQGTAVATLMKYCGYSVKMEYGESSGAFSSDVAVALKTYFGYNAETTQNISRSSYNASRWADIIYHEVANGRPVVYGGQSTGGGHEFVCDGYKYESGTDFFHINWGWGGMSDDYFVLSALDPDHQGIGGSTSTDGFRYDQDANIGIQPSTMSGTTADLTPVNVSLVLNSIEPSVNPATRYEPMTFKLNITNYGTDDYDGDISIGKYQGGSYYIIATGNSLVKAGETADVEIAYIPEEAGTMTLLVFGGDNSSMSGASPFTFTVTDGTQNNKVPIYGYYCDETINSQFIIPRESLADMAGSMLNSVTFYASTQSAISWDTAEFDVYLKEVSESTISSLYDWNSMEKVYSGTLSVGSDGKMTVTFEEPFNYSGDNLAVGFLQTESGDYAEVRWIGTTVSGVSLGGTTSSYSQQDFLPKTTFDYTPGVSTTPRPANVVVTPSSMSAIVTWDNGESAPTGYNVRFRPVVSYDFESAEPWAVDNFPPFTTYDGDGAETYVVNNYSFTNQGYTGSLIAFQNGTVGNFNSYSGKAFGCFMDAIPSTGGTNNDWFITPEIEISAGMVFSFWARSHTASYGLERIKVGVYGDADGTFASYLAGGPTTYVEVPTAWTQYQYDLSAYVGQTIRLAVNCVSEDAFALFIDELTVGSKTSWSQTVAGTAVPCTITGLMPQTTYELQVQNVYPEGESNWTSSVFFTTGELVPGDINGDGQLTAGDASLVLQQVANLREFTKGEKQAADVNGDGQVTAGDASLILQKVAGVIP